MIGDWMDGLFAWIVFVILLVDVIEGRWLEIGWMGCLFGLYLGSGWLM
jgi:hypothetical protein